MEKAMRSCRDETTISDSFETTEEEINRIKAISQLKNMTLRKPRKLRDKNTEMTVVKMVIKNLLSYLLTT